MKTLLLILVLASQAVIAGDLQQNGWPYLNQRDDAYKIIECDDDHEEEFNPVSFFMNAIVNMPKLTKLRLNCYLSWGSGETWKTLAGMKEIKELYIPHAAPDDKTVLKILENMELSALEVYACNLKQSTVLRIAEEETLEFLSFTGSPIHDLAVMITEKTAKALSTSKVLHTLLLNSFRVENDKVFDYLTDCKHLTRLELSFHTSYNGGAPYNSEWISKINKLSELHTLVPIPY